MSMSDEYEAGTTDPEAEAFVEKGEAEKEDAPPPRKERVREPDFDASAKPEVKTDSDEERAARMGWSPKDQWRGDPEKWVDAKTFNERTNPAILHERLETMSRKHEETVQRMERMNAAAIERTKKEAQAQLDGLKRERDDLIEKYAGDAKAIKQINANYEEAVDTVQTQAQPQGRPPEAEAWIKKHPQYDSDPVFQAAAFTTMGKIHTDMAGKPLSEQMEELDRRLAATGRFQDIYGEGKKPNASGSANGNGAPPADARQMDGVRIGAKKSSNYFGRLPAHAKSQFERFVRSNTMKADEAEAYAREYFEGDKE